MKVKGLIALLLTVLMIGGMFPTVFAGDGDAEITLVYDFASTALIKSDGTPNINTDNVSNTPTVRDSAISGYTLDRTRSTGYWKYESQVGVPYIGFQFNGLYFYTNNAEQPLNSSAMVFTVEIPKSGTYSASVSDHNVYANGEQVDLYLVSKDYFAEKQWDATKIEDIKAAIAISSMTDPAASVKYVASYDSYYQTTVSNKLAENMYLFAGEYYLFVLPNEATVESGSEHASKTYGMLSKLTLTSETAAAPQSSVYSFVAEAVANNTSAASVDMRLMKAYTQLDSTVSTGAWMYSGICNRMDGYTMYADKDGGATFRAATANLGNNAFILKAKVDASGIYKPSMIYTTYAQYGKLNVYFVPVSYADSKWTMSAADLNLSEVFADSGVKLVASQDAWVKSGSSANLVGEYDNVKLDEGEYYVLISLFKGSGDSSHASNTYFKTKGFTLTRQPEVSLTVSKDTLKIGESATISATLKDDAGNAVPTSGIAYKSLSPSVATVNDSGVVTGVEEGIATIQVTATSCGLDFTDTIDITVSRDVKYVLTLGATGGQKTVEFIRYNNIDANISAPWRYISKTNVDTGSLYDEGLQFRVISDNIGNGGYALKISVENPGIYIPSVTWTAAAHCSIVDTYIVPVAYANARWPMSNDMSLSEVVSDPGVTLIASADMSEGESKKGSPFKFSDDEYYVIVVISDLGNGNDSQGRAFGYLKSIELDWLSPLSEDVENQYVTLAIANNVNDNINVMGNRYKRGDEIEVEAPELDGYTFRHWVRGTEERSEFVSVEPSFTYKLITNTYLTAVYTMDTAANTVEFFGGNGEYIASVEVQDGEVAAPSAPSLTGFKFLDWYTSENKTLADTALTAPVTRAVAVFGETDDTFTVAGEENIKYDTKITKTYSAPVVWYRDDVRVGYGTEYEYFVWDNVGKITYVEGTAQPLVVLDKAIKSGNARMIEYDAGGKKIVEVGILFGDSAGITVDSCKYKATSKKGASHGQFTAKPYDDESCARGYLIYEENGKYKVIYSD